MLEGTALRALRGAARGRTFLAAGITTVRDLGNSGRFGDVALMRAIEEGSVDGPRMIASGPGLSPIGGQFPGLQPAWQSIAAEEGGGARDQRRPRLPGGAGRRELDRNMPTRSPTRRSRSWRRTA